MATRLAEGDLPRVSDTGQSHRTQWGSYRQLDSFPSMQGELTALMALCLPGHSLPGSSMVTWAWSRSNGEDSGLHPPWHLMGDLDHCHGPIRSSFVGRFIGPMAWGTVVESLSCPLFGDRAMTFYKALFDAGVKGCSPTLSPLQDCSKYRSRK